MNKNQTRRATPADEPQIQKILEKRIQVSVAAERAQFNWSKETLSEELKAAQVWIADADEGPIKAFLCFREGPDVYEITVLATDLNAARQGYQTNLLTKLKQSAEVEKKQIWLEVHAQNNPAIQFYKKNGFIISGQRKKYYADGGDAILMTFSPALN